jgi:hypothetical protein
MSQTIIKTQAGKRYFKRLSAMLVTPYEYVSTTDDWVIGSKTYDLYAIIGDTVRIEQAEGDKTHKFNEFTPLPVITNTGMGVWTFSADCLDAQNAVLKLIYGVEGADGITVFPEDVKECLCCIELQFSDSQTSVLLPKVSLNSTFLMENMKSSFLRNKITGTVLSSMVSFIQQVNLGSIVLKQMSDTDPSYRLQWSDFQTYTPMSFVERADNAEQVDTWGIWTDVGEMFYKFGSDRPCSKSGTSGTVNTWAFRI